MKKHVSPTPTPRAAALSQSASRFAAGATSAWQNIARNSPRLAAASPHGPGAARGAAPLAPPPAPGASRVALEPQRAVYQPAPAAAPATIRQVGWREVDHAVGLSTKRKYSVFGIGFGPKVPVVETEKVKLPVYQETNREQRYYAVVKQEDVARVRREGLQPAPTGSGNGVAAPPTISRFNAQGNLCCFTSQARAQQHGQQHLAGRYAVVAFVMPEYHDFTPDPESEFRATPQHGASALCTRQPIPAGQIKNVTTFHEAVG